MMTVPFFGRIPNSLANPTGAPQRLILIPSLNGGAPEHFWPSGGTMATIAQPLSAWSDKIQFIKGLNIDGSWDHMAIRSMFTGSVIQSYSAADPTVRSIDQVVANAFLSSDPAPVKSLHLAACPASNIAFYQQYGRSTFFFDPLPVDYQANPVTAFDNLAPYFGSEEPSNEDDIENLLDERVRDITRSEINALQSRLQTDPIEAVKLVRHLSSLPQSTTNITPVSCSTNTIPSVEALRSTLQGNASAAYNQNLYSDILDAQVDVLARAITCGVTRVATLQYNSADGNTPVPISSTQLLEHHNCSHGSGDTFALIQQWYATKIARLLTLLDVPDPLDPSGGTVLDNTVILWMNECNSGHDNVSVPCLYIGSGAGKLQTGGMLETSTTNKALLGTICDIMDVPASTSSHFGNDRIEGILL
jgi:hypothetical protein